MTEAGQGRGATGSPGAARGAARGRGAADGRRVGGGGGPARRAERGGAGRSGAGWGQSGRDGARRFAKGGSGSRVHRRSFENVADPSSCRERGVPVTVRTAQDPDESEADGERAREDRGTLRPTGPGTRGARTTTATTSRT